MESSWNWGWTSGSLSKGIVTVSGRAVLDLVSLERVLSFEDGWNPKWCIGGSIAAWGRTDGGRFGTVEVLTSINMYNLGCFTSLGDGLYSSIDVESCCGFCTTWKLCNLGWICVAMYLPWDLESLFQCVWCLFLFDWSWVLRLSQGSDQALI